jgi:hypothetical protein
MVECTRGGDCESSPGSGRPPRREFAIPLEEQEVFGGGSKLTFQDKLGGLVDLNESEMTGHWAIGQRCEPPRAKTHHFAGGQPLTPIPYQKATA